MTIAEGQRVRLPEADGFAVVEGVSLKEGGGCKLFVNNGFGIVAVDLTADELPQVEVLAEDGGADSRKVLAGLWAEWMRHVTHRSDATARDVTSLRPYPHQSQAVYGAMLPQPLLRFLLADFFIVLVVLAAAGVLVSVEYLVGATGLGNWVDGLSQIAEEATSGTAAAGDGFQ